MTCHNNLFIFIFIFSQQIVIYQMNYPTNHNINNTFIWLINSATNILNKESLYMHTLMLPVVNISHKTRYPFKIINTSIIMNPDSYIMSPFHM